MPAKPPAARRAPAPFDVGAFLDSAGVARRVLRFGSGTVVFAQGAPANSVFYLQDGAVKLSVLSAAGKESVVGMLGPGDFFGEGCLAGQPLRMGTASAVVPTTVLRIPINSSTRVKSAWPGRCCCWRATAGKPNRSESCRSCHRRRSPRWSAPPGRV